MRHKLSIITVALCAALMCGCFKDVIDYTNFNTAIYEQATTTGSYVRATDVEMYAYAVDTTEWRIASYEDALAHRITNKTTGEVLTEPDAYGSFNPSNEYQSSIRLDAPISMLVVVCPESKIYGYRNYELPENLASVDTKLYIALWRQTHNIAGWRIVNEFYTPPTKE